MVARGISGTSSVRHFSLVSPWNKIKELAELHSPSPVQWAGGPAEVGRGGAVRGVRVEKLNFYARRLGGAVEIGRSQSVAFSSEKPQEAAESTSVVAGLMDDSEDVAMFSRFLIKFLSRILRSSGFSM
jgi:hypothetical protein